MTKIFSLLLILLFFACPKSHAVEIHFGENKITCTNPAFGSFDIHIEVKDRVIETQYREDETNRIPVWETLESKLLRVTFTTGRVFKPEGLIAEVKGELSVERLALDGNPLKGMVQFSIAFPKEEGLPMTGLMVDHNHPEHYETSELGAQAFAHVGANFYQVFFQCK